MATEPRLDLEFIYSLVSNLIIEERKMIQSKIAKEDAQCSNGPLAPTK